MEKTTSLLVDVQLVGIPETRKNVANSPFFPICESGPLCPLLDDEDLLLDFFVNSNKRQELKRFCKTKNWDGKPKLPTVMTDGALKGLLRSACNSPEARQMLRISDKGIGLHQAIAGSVAVKKHELYEEVMQLCYEKKGKGGLKRFLKPGRLAEFLENFGSDGDDRELLFFLVLAFAMLEEETRVDLIYQLIKRFPHIAESVGVSVLDRTDDRSASINSHASQKKPVESEKDSLTPSVDVQVERLGQHVSCLLDSIDELKNKTKKIEESLSVFANGAERLATVTEVSQYAEQGEVNTLLHSLKSGKITIDAESQELLWLLRGDCGSEGENTCALKIIANEIQRNPLTRIDGLVAKANEMRQAAKALLVQEKAAKAEMLVLNKTETELKNQLQRPTGQSGPRGKDGYPCEVLATLAPKRQIVETLKHDLSVEVEGRRTDLVSRMDQMGGDNEANSGNSYETVARAIVDLRKQVASACSLSKIVECEAILREIENCIPERKDFDCSVAARQVLETPESLDDFLSLCEGLIAQGDGAVALLLLFLRQSLHPVEEISANVDRAIGALLAVACNAGTDELSNKKVWSVFCDDRWLLTVNRGDLGSTELLECLVVMYLGIAVLINGDKAANGLVSLGVDWSGQSVPELLREVVNAVIARSPYRIIPSAALQSKLKQERDILERIRFENGEYLHIQCGAAKHFARFEAIQVFPALEALWGDVSLDLIRRDYLSAHARIDGVDAEKWYENLARKHDKDIHSHPHYSAKIRGFIRDFVELLEEHIAYCETILAPAIFVLGEEEFVDALRQWAGNKHNRLALTTIITKELSAGNDDNENFSILEDLVRSRTVIAQCPSLVTWYRKQRYIQPEEELERLILQDLELSIPLADVEIMLEQEGAWEQLAILWIDRDSVRSDFYFGKAREEVLQLEMARGIVQNAKSPGLVEIFNSCLKSNRIHAAKAVIEECQSIVAKHEEVQKASLGNFLSSAIESLKAVKKAASGENMPETWGDKVYSYAGMIERKIDGLFHVYQSGEATDRRRRALLDAIEALKFLVNERSQDFDAVAFHLELSSSESSSAAMPTITEDEAAERCPELIKWWKQLGSFSGELSDEAELKFSWKQFVKAFAKVCNLYHDESHERKPFVTVPSINYPYTVFQTSFYRPQSEFLKRPLRLYLFSQGVDKQTLHRLEAEVSGEESAAWLHIVFAVQDLEKIRKHFKFDKGFRNFLIADDSFLYGICMAEKHDVPVRQALHASVTDLVSSSPFVAQGYCHQSNNIYVGRKEILQRLLNTPQAMIWGGRRIGKTSVLHALETVLLKKPEYSVALVYVDIEEGADPDLAIAQQIASRLELSAVSTVTELERQISAARRKGRRFAFLIDEVDEYIKKSRSVHGDKFPLATALRQLVMDDPSKETVLVYSGYHQLYFEAKLDKGKRRVGHPFVNIAQELPIRDLTQDDVSELVKTGFEEMLGIPIHPDVPALISKRASRHPAFVQEFCRCLLEYVSKRRSPGVPLTISTEDVEAVYKADGRGSGGEQPFIFYVEETLGYNLSDLGRAIMLTIEDENFHSIESIRDDLNIYSSAVGIENPKPEHFYQTIELLVMTNLLTQDPERNDYYRVTYPTFIDILGRLNKLGKAAIQKSLRKYDARERETGVLR